MQTVQCKFCPDYIPRRRRMAANVGNVDANVDSNVDDDFDEGYENHMVSLPPKPKHSLLSKCNFEDSKWIFDFW